MKNPIHQLIVTVSCITCFAFAGCSGLYQKRQQPTCKALFTLIETDWQRDGSAGLYRVGNDPKSTIVHDIIECQDCFIGLENKEIQKLFGKPDTLDKGAMVYYLRRPCLDTEGVNANGCHYMSCDFGKENTIVKVSFITNSFK